MKRAMAAAALLVAAACSGGSDSDDAPAQSESPAVAAKYDSLDLLAQAAIDAGLECDGYAITNLTTTGDGLAECPNGDLVTWYDESRPDYRERLGQELLFAESVASRGPSLVGPNWIIQTQAASDLVDELGGEVVTPQ